MIQKSKIKNQKSKLTEDEVKHVAKLARLDLSGEEMKKFQEQLSEILDYFEVLKELNTEKVEPTSQVTGLEDVFRNDAPGNSLTQAEATSGVKNLEKGMFKVKAIFE